MHANHLAQFQNAGRARTRGACGFNLTAVWLRSQGLLSLLQFQLFPGSDADVHHEAVARMPNLQTLLMPVIEHSSTRPLNPRAPGEHPLDSQGAGLATVWPAEQFHQYQLGLLGANSRPSLPELPPTFPLGLMTMGGASVLPALAPRGPRVSPKKRNLKEEFRIHMTPHILAKVCP